MKYDQHIKKQARNKSKRNPHPFLAHAHTAQTQKTHSTGVAGSSCCPCHSTVDLSQTIRKPTLFSTVRFEVGSNPAQLTELCKAQVERASCKHFSFATLRMLLTQRQRYPAVLVSVRSSVRFRAHGVRAPISGTFAALRCDPSNF